MNESLCARHLEAAALPLIDIAGLFSPDLDERAAVAKRIGAACREVGFFCIANHGVDAALQQAVFEQARAFCPAGTRQARPDKVFSKANRGYEPLRGQVLEAGAPADLGRLLHRRGAGRGRPAGTGRAFQPWCQPVAERARGVSPDHGALSRRDECAGESADGAIALSLQLPEDHFAGFCRDSMSTLRLLHYPPQPANAAPGEKGCGAHTDFGGLTLLLQDENPGLQVWDRHSKSWIHAVPVPGTYVVNLGDMIARWTNDQYRSTLHRVVNMSGRERYSVPFFFSGNPDHVVECPPICLAPGEAPRLPAVTVEEHHREMYRRTYG